MTIRSFSTVFLGIVVNPKTAEPVFVQRQEGMDRTVEILSLVRLEPAHPVTLEGQRAQRERGPQYAYMEVGEGYLNDRDDTTYGRATVVTGYPRSHTPQGIKGAYRSHGFGTCLYAGLTLLATAIDSKMLHATGLGGKGAGICSDSESRSDSATEWWDAAVARGLAHQQTGYVAGDPDKTETETLEDEELTSYMSTSSRARIRDAIDEAVSNYDSWSVSNISIRGDLEREIPSESEVELTAEYMTFKDLRKFKLVATIDPFEGDMEAWAKATSTAAMSDATADAYKDVILALNVAHQDMAIMGKLALVAKELGASDRDVADMMMRSRAGIDLPRHHKPPTFAQNPPPKRARRVPKPYEHERGLHRNPATIPVRTHPVVGVSDRETVRILSDLADRREALGWNTLEDLP